MNGTIQWIEDRKTGCNMLVLHRDDGPGELVLHDEPITARSDSHAIASLFGRFEVVEHDGDTIFVSTVDV